MRNAVINGIHVILTATLIINIKTYNYEKDNIIVAYNKKHVNKLIEELGMYHLYRRFKNHDDVMEHIKKEFSILGCNYIEGGISELI